MLLVSGIYATYKLGANTNFMSSLSLCYMQFCRYCYRGAIIIIFLFNQNRKTLRNTMLGLARANIPIYIYTQNDVEYKKGKFVVYYNEYKNFEIKGLRRTPY